MGKEVKKAVAYLRTSSRTNVGADKDSDKRQRAAIEAYGKAAGFQIVGEFYDAAVSGADPVSERSGFAEMLERLMSNGARTIIVESPDRFARDLMVQLAGHDMLKSRGVTLIAASAPMHFVENPPVASRRAGSPALQSPRKAVGSGVNATGNVADGRRAGRSRSAPKAWRGF